MQLNYYGALSSELLLTNLLLFPQCGRQTRPYEYDYDKVKTDQGSDTRSFYARSEWWSLAPREIQSKFKPILDKVQGVTLLEKVHYLASLVGDPKAALKLLAKVPLLHSQQGPPLHYSYNSAYLARCLLTAWASQAWKPNETPNYLEAAAYEYQSAQELNLPYLLDLERCDNLRMAWLEMHQSSSPFVRLMYADSQLLALRKLVYEPMIDEQSLKEKYAFRGKQAWQAYHTLYDPDAEPSLFQLAVQIRLLLCHAFDLCDRPDWLEAMGFLFHRTSPIVFQRWQTLMGLVGESLVAPMNGVRFDPQQALEIYRTHHDHYRIAKLYATHRFQVRQPRRRWLEQMDLAIHSQPPLYVQQRKIPGSGFTSHLAARFCVGGCSGGPSVFGSRWGKEAQEVFDDASLQQAYGEGRRKFSPYLIGEGINAGIYEFFFELENKRCSQLAFAQMVHYKPDFRSELVLLNSGILKSADPSLPLCAGQLVQLYGDAEGKGRYLKCYGYPLYPIYWYQVDQMDSSEVANLTLIKHYLADASVWESFAYGWCAPIRVRWLPMPIFSTEG